MAKQESLFRFIGKLGDVIGYERNGEFFLRAAPKHVRRTAASRRAAKRFGIASRRGALIRSTFLQLLDMDIDSDHINRLNSALIRATGNDIARITGFRFNEQTGIDKFFGIAPVVSADGTFYIPPQALPQWKNICALEVKVIAARISFTTLRVINTGTFTTTIPLDAPFTGTVHTLNAPGTGTLVVTMQVRAMFKDGPSCNKQFQAADIIGVIVPPLPQGDRLKKQAPQSIASPDAKPALLIMNTGIQTPVIQRE